MVLPQLLTDCCESTENSRDGKSFLLKCEVPPIPYSLIIRHERITIGGDRRTPLSIESLTITNANVTFRNIHIKAKIEVLSGSCLTCENCIFEPFSEDDESTIDVCKRAQVTLSNCHFVTPTKFSLVFQEESRGSLHGCVFDAPEHSSVRRDSIIEVCQCPSIRRLLFQCIARGNFRVRVRPTGRKALFVLKDSTCAVTSCKFEGMHEGAITVSEN
jgi:hypothetical protein